MIQLIFEDEFKRNFRTNFFELFGMYIYENRFLKRVDLEQKFNISAINCSICNINERKNMP